MAYLIKDRTIVTDDWKLLEPVSGESPEQLFIPAGNVLLPLATWLARKHELIQRQWDQGLLLGVWLAPDDSPEHIAADLSDLDAIGIHFPSPTDGRGYSLAASLRGRYGYRGELRAFGKLGRDQVHFLHRIGFDTIVTEAPEQDIAGLTDFSVAYQGDARQPLPLFKRDAAEPAAAAS